MAQILIPNDLLLFRVYCTLHAQTSITAFDYKVLSVVGEPLDQLVLDTFNTRVATLFKAFLSQEASYYGASLSTVRDTKRLIQVTTRALTGLGTGPPKALPKQTCGLIKVFTALAGRHYRGRRYLPFPGYEAPATAEFPDGTQVGVIRSISDATMYQFTAVAADASAVLQPMLLHKATRPPLAPAPDPTPITGGKEVAYWATQRRRGDYGEPNLPSF